MTKDPPTIHGIPPPPRNSFPNGIFIIPLNFFILLPRTCIPTIIWYHFVLHILKIYMNYIIQFDPQSPTYST